MPRPPADPWCLVVPVKRLALAKTRLADVAGEHRVDLALAFALDTATAALACDDVRAVVVVTDEPDAARALRGARCAGGRATSRTPVSTPRCCTAPPSAARAHPGTAVGALSADLPRCDPTSCRGRTGRRAAASVRRSSATPRAAVRRRCWPAARATSRPPSGRGRRPAHLPAAPSSCRRRVPSLRQDVDTAADLALAARDGRGAAHGSRCAAPVDSRVRQPSGR